MGIASFMSLGDLIEKNLKELERNTNILTGFKEFDDFTGGLQKSNLIVIASRPSMGKTIFIENMLANITCNNNIPVAYFSIESSENEVLKRLLSNKCNIPIEKVETCKLTDEDNTIVNRKLESLSKICLYINSEPHVSINDLCSKAKSIVSEFDVKVIFIDYLQAITAKATTIANREQEIGYIIRSLKALARELDIPIVVTSKLNRRMDNKMEAIPRDDYKRPQLADLRDSGAIEDDADIVCFIHRPELLGLTADNEGNSMLGVAEIIVAKHRHGFRGEIRLKLEREYCRFVDMEYCDIFKPTDNISMDLTQRFDENIPF